MNALIIGIRKLRLSLILKKYQVQYYRRSDRKFLMNLAPLDMPHVSLTENLKLIFKSNNLLIFKDLQVVAKIHSLIVLKNEQQKTSLSFNP
ncbi:MAG: hypothetical protein ACJA0X_003144 [Cyclobacteriaceae bacterium]|jgi:hypothetical protein